MVEAQVSFLLQEQPMNTKLQIYTEADYLRAHMTAIPGEFRRRPTPLDNLKHQLSTILKRWLAAQTRIRG
jgi:hypothetical protein